MNRIADRIQALRKAKGISQEELANKLSVSRQAVSKWESGQSMPDIQKVIMISDFFGVTTDYILKGTEPQEKPVKKLNASVFCIIATVCSFIGLITAAAVWYEKQVATAIAIGLIFMALGVMIFAVGTVVSAEHTKQKAIYQFWLINIWFLLFIPFSCIYNIISQGIIAPYPLICVPVQAFFVCIGLYLVICSGIDFIIIKKKRSE